MYHIRHKVGKNLFSGNRSVISPRLHHLTKPLSTQSKARLFSTSSRLHYINRFIPVNGRPQQFQQHSSFTLTQTTFSHPQKPFHPHPTPPRPNPTILSPPKWSWAWWIHRPARFVLDGGNEQPPHLQKGAPPIFVAGVWLFTLGLIGFSMIGDPEYQRYYKHAYQLGLIQDPSQASSVRKLTKFNTLRGTQLTTFERENNLYGSQWLEKAPELSLSLLNSSNTSGVDGFKGKNRQKKDTIEIKKHCLHHAMQIATVLNHLETQFLQRQLPQFVYTDPFESTTPIPGQTGLEKFGGGGDNGIGGEMNKSIQNKIAQVFSPLLNYAPHLGFIPNNIANHNKTSDLTNTYRYYIQQPLYINIEKMQDELGKVVKTALTVDSGDDLVKMLPDLLARLDAVQIYTENLYQTIYNAQLWQTTTNSPQFWSKNEDKLIQSLNEVDKKLYNQDEHYKALKDAMLSKDTNFQQAQKELNQLMNTDRTSGSKTHSRNSSDDEILPYVIASRHPFGYQLKKLSNYLASMGDNNLENNKRANELDEFNPLSGQNTHANNNNVINKPILWPFHHNLVFPLTLAQVNPSYNHLVARSRHTYAEIIDWYNAQENTSQWGQDETTPSQYTQERDGVYSHSHPKYSPFFNTQSNSLHLSYDPLSHSFNNNLKSLLLPSTTAVIDTDALLEQYQTLGGSNNNNNNNNKNNNDNGSSQEGNNHTNTPPLLPILAQPVFSGTTSINTLSRNQLGLILTPSQRWMKVFGGELTFEKGDVPLTASLNSTESSRYIATSSAELFHKLHPSTSSTKYGKLYENEIAKATTQLGDPHFNSSNDVEKNKNVFNPFYAKNLLSLPDIPFQ